MTPTAYLLFSIQHKCYRRLAWIISAFSVTQETEAQKADLYPGKLIREPFGLFVVLNENGDREKIEPVENLTQPLFTKNQAIEITPAWLGSVTEPAVNTTIGRLLINLVCLWEAFGKKFPYQNAPMTPGKLEAMIAPKLMSNPPEIVEHGRPEPYAPIDDGNFYVFELEKFAEGVGMLEITSQLFAYSVTQVGLLPPPGRKAFREQLLKKYEGKLTDPVEMAKFEAELDDFDKAYLKNDPSYGKFMSGKPKRARMKSYLTQGGESNSFTGDVKLTPIPHALEDGIPLDPEGFTAISNTIRYGSYSRGAETVNGGVVAKGLMRAADNWRITPGDCGTSLGIHRLYRGGDVKDLVGRYLVIAKKPVLIESDEQARLYAGREVIVRSPQYCSRPGTQTCEVCAGLALAKYPTGLPIPLMEVSGGILTDSLKLMHNTALVTERVDLPSVIT